eukprot:scaffold29181_cov54-Attheya_sp.AAC.1
MGSNNRRTASFSWSVVMGGTADTVPIHVRLGPRRRPPPVPCPVQEDWQMIAYQKEASVIGLVLILFLFVHGVHICMHIYIGGSLEREFPLVAKVLCLQIGRPGGVGG